QRFVSDEGLPEVEDESVSNVASEVEGLLKALTAQHREVILLRFVDGFKLEEIADMLDIPLGTVKSRVHNAISRLRSEEDVKKFFFP
ncbi:MAG: sigma-70 family RNA polymerase sigma factor, partial [Pseudomonadota bacterium]